MRRTLKFTGAIGASVAALLPLAFCAALAQSPLRARADNGREVILRADGTWTYADAPATQPPATKPPAVPPAAAAQPAPQPPPPPAPRTAATPPVVPPSAAMPSVRSLVTPPTAASGTAPAPPAASARAAPAPPPAPAPSATAAPPPTAAPTISPGAGAPPARVAAPAPPNQPAPAAQPAAPIRPAGLPQAIQRPRTTTAMLETRRGSFRIWYNPAIWQPSPETAEGRVEFRQSGGPAIVVVIPEGTPLPLVALRTAAVENARRSGPDARIVAEQTRRIGTRDVLLLQIDATLTAGNQPVTYLGHYFGDPRGSIQVVGAVAQRDLERVRPVIQELLDGLDLNRP